MDAYSRAEQYELRFVNAYEMLRGSKELRNEVRAEHFQSLSEFNLAESDLKILSKIFPDAMIPESVQAKIYTGSIRELRLTPTAAKKWLITRSSKKIPGTELVQELAPSPKLFKQFLYKWKTKDPNFWWPLYKAEFIRGFQKPEFRAALNKIWQSLEAGTDVGLFCYCPSEEICHRNLIKEYLKTFGIQNTPLASLQPTKSSVSKRPVL